MPRVEEPGGTYFVNFSLLDELTALTPAEREAVLLVIMESNLKKYYLHAIVVMPTHVHMVVQALADGVPVPLPKITHHIKGFSAYKVNQLRGAKGPLWLPRSHNRLLISKYEYEQKLNYIYENPRCAELVDNPFDYPYLWFIGKDRNRNPEPG